MTFKVKDRVWHPGLHASGQWTGLGTVRNVFATAQPDDAADPDAEVHVRWDNDVEETYRADELSLLLAFRWSDAEHDEMHQRVRSASSGPWCLPFEDGAICRPYDDRDRELDEVDEREVNEDDDVSLCAIDEDKMGIVGRRADAEFIVVSRRLVPAMLAEIERLRTAWAATLFGADARQDTTIPPEDP